MSDLSIKHVMTYTEIKPKFSLVNEEGMNIKSIEENVNAEVHTYDHGYTRIVPL